MQDVLKHIEREMDKEDAEKAKFGPGDGLLSEAVIATILKFTLLGLQFIHSKSQVHRCAFVVGGLLLTIMLCFSF